MVMLVATILAAVMFTSGSSNVISQLQATSAVIAGDLARARSLAVTNNSTYRVTFDLTNNQFYLEYSGSNSALSNLPSSSYYTGQDTATRQYTQIAYLPAAGGNVKIVAVGSNGSTPAPATQVEFGQYGQTTQPAETQVWLTAGSGASTLYQWVRINPVTGLATVEAVQNTPPPAAMLTSGSAGS